MKGYKRNTVFSDFVTERDTSVCWLFNGPTDEDGYGMFHGSRAHRVSYKIAFGEVPAGRIIHHICRNRLCVNTKHLVAVLPRNHSDDGGAQNRQKTHCKNGHEFTSDNTYTVVRKDRGNRTERQCRICSGCTLEKIKKLNNYRRQ